MKPAKILQKFKLNDGDILLVKAGSALAEPSENMTELLRVIQESDRKNVIVVVVDDFSDLKTIDEAAMNAHGWFRIEALRRLIKQVESKESVE